MKYKEFIKIRNTSHTKERQAIYENLKKILDLPDDDAVSAPAESRSVSAEKAASKRRTSFKNFFKKPARFIACISTAVAVACLAIILPFTLNNRGNFPAVTPPSISDNPSMSKDRYCAVAACRQIELKYSLKEYSARHNLSLLHVDWYDVADIKTSLYVNKENSFDIIYYEEILEHRYTGSIVELYITYLNTKVDIVEGYKKACKYRYDAANNPNRSEVYWGFEVENRQRNTFETWFRYKQYVYTIVLRYPMSENSIFELIDSVLPLDTK